MDRQKLAAELHESGFNCAQSVFGAFCDLTGTALPDALKIAGGFGGGLRQGEICGAASGGVMVIGCMFPFNQKDDNAKKKIADITVAFLTSFREKFGKLPCRDLLGVDISTPEGAKRNTEEGIAKGFCPGLICGTVELVERVLEANR